VHCPGGEARFPKMRAFMADNFMQMVKNISAVVLVDVMLFWSYLMLKE
jgi:hypothetical protein